MKIYPKKSDRSSELLEYKLGREEDKYNKIKLKDLFCGKRFYPSFSRGMLIMLFQQFTGINVTIYFGNDLFKKENFGSISQYTLILNFVTTIIVIFIIDRVGRKLLLLIGSISITIYLAGLTSIIISRLNNEALFLIMTFILMTLFGLTYGPVALVYINEIQPTKGYVITYSFHWFLNLLIIAVYSVLKATGIGSSPLYIVFSVFMTFSIFYVFKFVKETKKLYPKSIKYLHVAPGENTINESGEF